MSTDITTGRRDALKSLAGSAIALASLGAAACAAPAQTISTAPTSIPPVSGRGNWDMSWLQKINKRRRMVFDTSDVMDGMGIGFVAAYLEGAADAYGDPDASTVLVHRHSSVSIVLNDEMWKRIGLGETHKMKDSKTGEFVQVNPFLSKNQKNQDFAEGTLDKLMGKGTIVVACNRALTARAFTLASKEKISRDEARKQLFAAIVPGVYVVPNGVFGVCAAQEAGCGYIRVQN